MSHRSKRIVLNVLRSLHMCVHGGGKKWESRMEILGQEKWIHSLKLAAFPEGLG